MDIKPELIFQSFEEKVYNEEIEDEEIFDGIQLTEEEKKMVDQFWQWEQHLLELWNLLGKVVLFKRADICHLVILIQVFLFIRGTVLSV